MGAIEGNLPIGVVHDAAPSPVQYISWGGSVIQAKVIKNDLDQIASRLGPSVDQAVSSGADRVASRWKATTRVLTGAHRDSIHVEQRGEAHYAIVADSDHSAYTELGTRYQRGDHAGVNALNDEKDRITREIAEAVEP